MITTVRASAAGTFSLRCPPRDPCNDVFVIAAVGAKGDTAHLKVMPRACPPSNATP